MKALFHLSAAIAIVAVGALVFGQVSPPAISPPATTPVAVSAPATTPAPTAAPAPGAAPAPAAVPVSGPPPAAEAPAPVRVSAPRLDPIGSHEPPAPSEEHFKIFSLTNADASETVDQLRQLLGPVAAMVADSRTNTILASGTSDKLAVVEAFVTKLDSMESRSSKSDNKDANQKPVPAPQNESRRTGGGFGGVAGVPGAPAASGRAGFGGAGGRTGGGGGGFGAGGFSGGWARSGEAPPAGAFPAGVISDFDQQLRAADAAAKAAEAQLGEAAALTKKAAELAAAGKSDESMQVSRKLLEMLENQRRAGEEQRRALEEQRRAWEEQRRQPNAPIRAGGNPMAAAMGESSEKTREANLKLAEQYRAAVGRPAETEDAKRERDALVADLRKKMEAEVGESVKAQIQSQLREVKQMRERLEKLERDIAERDKNQDELVARKLKALLGSEAADKLEPAKSDEKLERPEVEPRPPR
jgi:hypothetical protein